MSKAYNTAYLLDGREWGVDANGAQTLSCKYEVLLESPLSNASLVASFSGLPAIGSAHPSFGALFAQSYKVREGEGSQKNRIEVVVEYAPIARTGEPEEVEEGSTTLACFVEAMGWRSGSVQRDFTVDAVTGAPVLNTAGQPFDSVPQVDRPSPTWFKTFKTPDRYPTFVTYVNKVNSSTMTIAGQSFAAGTLRCVQADEERVFADASGYKYRYSIALQAMSNLVKLQGANTTTQCGWHLPIVSTGTMQKVGGSLKRITVQTDDGQEVPVGAPVLLDGNGAFSPSNTTPYAVLFKAYQETTFPAMFTSEPSAQQEEEE